MSSPLPCTTCPGLCCGPILLSSRRLKAIEGLIATFTSAERQRLARQRRTSLTCHFYDTEQRRCSVYDQRPQICRMYGLTGDLACPRQPANFVLTIAPATARLLAEMDTADYATNSVEWDWP
jgi:Fe-S-cluster containining protein